MVAVGMQCFIDTHQCRLFDMGLSDEQAIERVVVMCGDIRQCQHVVSLDRKWLDDLRLGLLMDDLLERYVESELAKLVLELDFPQGCNTQKQLIGFVLARIASGCRELARRIH